MNDSPLVTIRIRGTVAEVATSENGFQGHGIVAGVTPTEARTIAQALLPVLLAKGQRSLDMETDKAHRIEWERPEHRDSYLEAIQARRAALVARAYIHIDD